MPIYGTNVAGTAAGGDASSLIFADLIKGASSGFSWGGGTIEADGYPVSVDFDANPAQGYAITTVGMNAHLPAGTYTFKALGTGRIGTTGIGLDGNPGWLETDLTGGETVWTHTLASEAVVGSNWLVRITQSSASDRVRSLRIYPPGAVDRVFYGPYLQTLQKYSCLRFMDWLGTNGSTWTNWADRPATVLPFSQYGYIDLSYCVDLGNALGIDIYVHIPALFTDDAIAEMASYIDGRLNPGLKIYVAYSNEVWNGSMPQWAQLNQKIANDPNGATYGGTWQAIAYYDAHATNLFKQNISSGRTCIIVIERQAEYDDTIVVAMNIYKAYNKTFGGVAMGPYFSSTADLNANATLFQTDPATAVANMIAGFYGTGATDPVPTVAKCLDDVARWKTRYADPNGVPLIFYEYGMGLGNYADADEPLAEAVNMDPAMYDVYAAFHRGLPDGVGPCNHYFDCAHPNKFGDWGACFWTNQAFLDPAPPKYRALMDAISGGGAVNPPPPVNVYRPRRFVRPRGKSS